MSAKRGGGGKGAPQVRRGSEARFRMLVENSADGIALSDRDGIILFASPSGARVLGYSAEELVGRNGFEIVHPADLVRTRALYAQCLAEPGVAVKAEFRYRHRDGGWRHVEAVGVSRLDDPGVGAAVRATTVPEL